MRNYVRVMGVVTFIFCAVLAGAADLTWENISGEISDVNAVLVDKLNPEYLYAGTGRGVFMTKDAGKAWKAASRLSRRINFLAQDNQSIIYAAAAGGLFITNDQGKNWKKIFGGRDSQEGNCRTLAISKNNVIFLGTDAGLFISKDRGRNWQREKGRLGSAAIVSIAEDSLHDVIYVASPDKVFKLQGESGSYATIFTTGSAEEEEDNESETEDSTDTDSSGAGIRGVAVASCQASRVYLVAKSRVYTSDDQGLTWDHISDFGLLSKDIKSISLSPRGCELYTITKSGIFLFKEKRWQELSLRLPVVDIRFLAIDNQDSLYAAADKGIFKAAIDDSFANAGKAVACFKGEPAIEELHAAAIRYAEVIDPIKMENLRKQAKLKAILPSFSLDYDKTVTSYSNSSSTRFEIGPPEWGLSFKWDLSDLIWSEQQRLIDSQARLMIVLRNDILDEVNKLYFERRRVKIELAYLSPQESRKIEDKKLRLEELAASLDALTGGFFSRRLNN